MKQGHMDIEKVSASLTPDAVKVIVKSGNTVKSDQNSEEWTSETRPGDLVGAGPNWVTFWSKFVLF